MGMFHEYSTNIYFPGGKRYLYIKKSTRKIERLKVEKFVMFIITFQG